jgi:hypothetical protein
MDTLLQESSSAGKSGVVVELKFLARSCHKFVSRSPELRIAQSLEAAVADDAVRPIRG